MDVHCAWVKGPGRGTDPYVQCRDQEYVELCLSKNIFLGYMRRVEAFLLCCKPRK